MILFWLPASYINEWLIIHNKVNSQSKNPLLFGENKSECVRKFHDDGQNFQNVNNRTLGYH